MTIGIHQLLPVLEREDAIGDYARILEQFLREKGFDSRIFVYQLKPGQEEECLFYRQHRRFSSPRNILIFHTAIGSPLAGYFKNRPDKKILVHHNITPPLFFSGWDPEVAYLAHQALKQLRELAGSVQATLADSPFNARQLTALGFPEPEVIPLIFDWKRLAGKADENVLKKYSDDRINLLFVGRVAPNKKQEDLLHIFYHYQKYFNPRSRLFLVGENRQFPYYTKALFNLVGKLGLKDVVFTGKVSSEALRAYYRLARSFVCMSEHEGLGVPLVEAMFYRIPIVAFTAAAVPRTLNSAGILVKEKRFPEIAYLLHQIMTDSRLRKKIIQAQNQRLDYFRNFPYRARWEAVINRLL